MNSKTTHDSWIELLEERAAMVPTQNALVFVSVRSRVIIYRGGVILLLQAREVLRLLAGEGAEGNAKLAEGQIGSA